MNSPDIYRKALAYERDGRLTDAGLVYRQLLRADPQHEGALTRLGLIEARSSRPEAAIPYFEKALTVNPSSAMLRLMLGSVFLHLHRPDKAETHLRKALRLDDTSVETLTKLSACCFALGRTKKAESYIQKAIALHPTDARLWLDVARIRDISGDREEAHAIYRRLIHAGTVNAAVFDGFAHSQKFLSEPPELAMIDRILSDPKAPIDNLRVLYFAAGKINQDLGRYDCAFEQFSKGNSLRQTYNERAHTERMKLMEDVFTPEFFMQRSDFAHNSQRPIFVFGMPRSGTSLVEQILASHPNVVGANELPFFTLQTYQLGEGAERHGDFIGAIDKLTRQDCRRITTEYLELLEAYGPGVARVVDKMPHNFERLWLIALLFPRATFFHCQRDPMDNCVSCFTSLLGKPHGYAANLGMLGRYYLRYKALIALWRRVLPITIHDVNYEHLVADPETESRRLIAHAGLPWNDACLKFHETDRPVHSLSRHQVKQPIYRQSVQSWRRYEPHLGPLYNVLYGSSDLPPAPEDGLTRA